MNRFDVVALTLAEVALVTLFTVVAVTFPSYGRLRKEVRTLRESSHEAEGLRRDVRALMESSSEGERLRRENLDLRTLLQSLQSEKSLRSQAMPSCVELHRAAGSLFGVTVAGKDQFVVGTRVLSRSALLREYAYELQKAERSGCRQRIDVFCRLGTTGPDYVSGLRALREYFYTSIMDGEQ